MLTVLTVDIGDSLTCGEPLPCAPQDVDIHPGQSLLATGVIDGHLVLHGFSKAESEQKHKVKVRGQGCRATAAAAAAASRVHLAVPLPGERAAC